MLFSTSSAAVWLVVSALWALAAGNTNTIYSQSEVEYDPLRTGERPKMFVDYLNGPLKGEVSKFVGNATAQNSFKLLELQDNMLLIGAVNNVYFLDTRTMREIKPLRIVWSPALQDIELCSLKGKSKSECQNYIRIIAKLDQKKLLICGTHAYRPKCRHYKFQEGRYTQEKEFEGIGLSPFDPYHNSSYVMSGGDLYTATVSDFSGSDPLIYKEPLRTAQSDFKQLNSPDFVKSLDDGEFVYFFFREQAVEFINCGKSVYSRVARVCRSDAGGPNKYKNSWTTFLKSRLNCSLPGEYPFYFDHLQAASDIVDGTYGGQASRLVYAVFTTPKNSISGNAICAFRLRDLLDTFEGAFKEQETANSNWLPVAKIKEPIPRPGRCSADPKKLPETSLNFVRGHSIMDEAVPSFFGGRPLFVKANLMRPTQFRELAVDPQVQTSDGQTYDVLFVGTTKGRVLKIVNTADPTNLRSSQPTLIEEIIVFQPNVPIERLRVVKHSTETTSKLVVMTTEAVISIPVARCSAAKSCHSCIALQDPYCAWDISRSICTHLQEHLEAEAAKVDSASFLQNVIEGKHKQCGAQFDENEFHNDDLITSNGRNDAMVGSPEAPSSSQVLLDQQSDGIDGRLDPEGNPFNDHLHPSATNGRGGVGGGVTILQHGEGFESHYSTEELSMAVATSCVCALVVGFVSGFLLARRCSCSRREENPYHVPYLNQSGYQDDQIYAKVDDMTYYPVNNMLVSLPNTNSTSHSSHSPALPSVPPPSSLASKTLSLHHPRPVDFQGFGTVHRSQKIFL